MENRRGWIASLREKTPAADESGTLLAFGMKLAEIPSGLWCAYAEKLLGSGAEAVRMIEEAAARSAYEAGRAVLDSPELRDGAGAKPSDGAETLNALFALAAAWGWADAEVSALQAPESMTVRARAYAEAGIADMEQVRSPAAFAFRGICRAFMDLAFGAAYPEGFGTYHCHQSFAIELGDPYGEFVVTRAGP